MPFMPWESCFVLTVVGLLVVGLARNWASPDALVVSGVFVIMLVATATGSPHLPSPAAAVAGFGNPAPLTVGVLFAVVAGLVHTGALERISNVLIGRPRSLLAAQARFVIPVWASSAFLNNTPIVAMFLPVVSELSRRTGISPSRLFIPLSYASILGGVCTLIGTSTNLVVNGLLISHGVLPEGLSMFDITWLGLPVAVVGLAFVLALGPWLLPDRRPALTDSDPREYMIERVVDPRGALVNRTIEEAGLRHLPGLYLTSIERAGRVIPAVGPDVVLLGGDHLTFAGVVESVVDLRKIQGLLATEEAGPAPGVGRRHLLVEAVVSDACPLIGSTIREGKFRTRYDASVVALARGAQRISGKLGDMVLLAGDTLLLEADPAFLAMHRRSREFFLVSPVDGSMTPRHERAPVALGILVAMIVVAGFGWLDMLTAAGIAAILMVAAGACTVSEARQSIDWSVLLVIGGALGLGHALNMSGAASTIAGGIVGLAGPRPWLVLLAVYLTTTFFTELITNNAAVALVFPIAVATAESLDASPMPFVMCIMIAGSASFATPIGYQTNLMVYGPGGYSFGDFLRIGVPLNLVVMVTAVALAPRIWPF